MIHLRLFGAFERPRLPRVGRIVAFSPISGPLGVPVGLKKADDLPHGEALRGNPRSYARLAAAVVSGATAVAR